LAAPIAPPAPEVPLAAPATELAAPASAPAVPAQVASPAAAAPAGGAATAPRLTAPDPGEEIFRPRRDLATPGGVSGATPEPDGTPHLDLEATRRRAREIASEGPGSPGMLNLVPPPPPEEKKKYDLAKAIAKAAKPDCREAYAGLGLLAIAPLLVSTLGNGGCNW
jgi:hypothetical protein